MKQAGAELCQVGWGGWSRSGNTAQLSWGLSLAIFDNKDRSKVLSLILYLGKPKKNGHKNGNKLRLKLCQAQVQLKLS